MILTTTNTIEGYKIQDYSGIVTGVSVSVKTSFSFKKAKNKTLYNDFINKAKEEAFQDLKTNATKLIANAIVGITIDIENSPNGYFMVSITGTAVHVV